MKLVKLMMPLLELKAVSLNVFDALVKSIHMLELMSVLLVKNEPDDPAAAKTAAPVSEVKALLLTVLFVAVERRANAWVSLPAAMTELLVKLLWSEPAKFIA